MRVPNEIIILFFIISFLVYTMPTILVNFSRTLKGKFLLLVLTIVITLYNKTGGIIMAMLFIFLAEFNYEFNSGLLYEGFTNITSNIDNESLNYIRDSDTLLIKKNNNDQLAIQQALQPVNSATINL